MASLSLSGGLACAIYTKQAAMSGILQPSTYQNCLHEHVTLWPELEQLRVNQKLAINTVVSSQRQCGTSCRSSKAALSPWSIHSMFHEQHLATAAHGKVWAFDYESAGSAAYADSVKFQAVHQVGS